MRALVAVVVVVAVSGCRNDVVGEPPLPDAGFEGEGEGAEGEGEGECADADAAVSVHIADDTGFPIPNLSPSTPVHAIVYVPAFSAVTSSSACQLLMVMSAAVSDDSPPRSPAVTSAHSIMCSFASVWA